MRKIVSKILPALIVIAAAVCSYGLYSPRVFIGVGAPIFEFDVISTQTISGVFAITAGNSIRVDWGDGTSNTYTGTSDQAYSKNYGSVGNRVVRIYAAAESVLTKFTMNQSGANISFNLADAPAGITNLSVTGSNTISGSLADAPAGITYLSVTGNNTISGSLADAPAGITTVNVYGSNTISGSLADAPAGITYLSVYGSNTISGSLADAPAGITNLSVSGSNTISGSLADAPAGITYLSVTGNNIISEYSTPWPFATSAFRRISLTTVTGGGLSSAEVDQLLIDADSSVTTWSTEKSLTLTGTNAARTSASDAAVAALIAKGVTVTTN